MSALDAENFALWCGGILGVTLVALGACLYVASRPQPRGALYEPDPLEAHGLRTITPGNVDEFFGCADVPTAAPEASGGEPGRPYLAPPATQAWWLCPNGECEHGAILHDSHDFDDPRPTCCAEGCTCPLTMLHTGGVVPQPSAIVLGPDEDVVPQMPAYGHPATHRTEQEPQQ